MSSTLQELNARRLLCPMPVIRVQEAMKTLQPNDQLKIICTDPGVKFDIPAWCKVHGHKVLNIKEENHEIIIVIEKGSLT